MAANLPALGLSNKAVFEGDVEEMTNAEEDHTALQSFSHSSSTPTGFTEIMQHPPFEEHLLQHTLWPEVEKLYVSYQSFRLQLGLTSSLGMDTVMRSFVLKGAMMASISHLDAR